MGDYSLGTKGGRPFPGYLKHGEGSRKNRKSKNKRRRQTASSFQFYGIPLLNGDFFLRFGTHRETLDLLLRFTVSQGSKGGYTAVGAKVSKNPGEISRKWTIVGFRREIQASTGPETLGRPEFKGTDYCVVFLGQKT